jgi:hypothetical protein
MQYERSGTNVGFKLNESEDLEAVYGTCRKDKDIFALDTAE